MASWDFDLQYGAALAEHFLYGARTPEGGSFCSKAWCLCERTGHWFLREPLLVRKRFETLPPWQPA